MQERIREYLRDVARSRGRQIDLSLLGYGTTAESVLGAFYKCDFIRRITVRSHAMLRKSPPESVGLICGADAFTGISEDVIFASPSVRREKLKLGGKALITSDTELFFSHPPELVFAVSGSDGKSTVTSYASLLLSPTFPSLFTGGNLGTPTAMASLHADAFLLELSSFNLRYVTPVSKRAVLTNVTPNHLDWHADIHEYEECKAKLVHSAKESVIPLSCPFNEELARTVSPFALVSDRHTHRELTEGYATAHTVTCENGWICIDGDGALPTESVRLKERHNLENLMSAIALSLGYVSRERICEVAESFTGLGHRCRRMTYGGKEYIDSSIDTTPERTKTTLLGIGKRVHIILGGRGKGLSLFAMRDALLRYALSISIYGEIANDIDTWLGEDEKLSRIPRKKFTRLEDAIECADALASIGETVLLSPAATSYGEFTSYHERGEFFKDHIVKKHGRI